MTNFESKSPPPVGAFWINEEDYPALLEIFTNSAKMPRTFREWLKIAEEMERGLKACGHVVMRVHNSGLVHRPWHEPGWRWTQKVRRRSRKRKIWR